MIKMLKLLKKKAKQEHMSNISTEIYTLRNNQMEVLDVRNTIT